MRKREQVVACQEQSTLAAWRYHRLWADNKKGSDWLKASRGKRWDWMRSNSTRRMRREGREAQLREALLIGDLSVWRWLRTTQWRSRARHPGKPVTRVVDKVGSKSASLKLQGVCVPAQGGCACRRYIWEQKSWELLNTAQGYLKNFFFLPYST